MWITREAIIGVVGIIARGIFRRIPTLPENSPPALCYGNGVMLKPADLVQGSGHALAGIIFTLWSAKGRFQPSSCLQK